MKFNNWLKTILFLVIPVLTAGLLFWHLAVRSAATVQPATTFKAKIIGVNEYTGDALTASQGQTIRIRTHIDNPTAGNTIDDLQVHSVFDPVGLMGWTKADGLEKQYGYITLNLGGNGLRYKLGSTKFARYDGTTWIFEDLADVGTESEIMTTYHRANLAGGANMAYEFFYDVDVVAMPAPIFNTHSSDQPLFQVHNDTQNQPAGSQYAGSVSANPGDELTFLFWVHNNTWGSTAANTIAKISGWPGTATGAVTLTGTVDADNSDPATRDVQLTFTAPSTLQLIAGSTLLFGQPTLATGGTYNGQALADTVTTAGVQIGQVGSGNISGCWEFVTQLKVRAKVSGPVPTNTPTPTATPTPTPTGTLAPTLTSTPGSTTTPTPSQPTPTMAQVKEAAVPKTQPETGFNSLWLVVVGGVGIILRILLTL